MYNHDRLQWQFQWQGPKLTNIRILVCEYCLDTPQEQLRTIILPPDPVPIQNPRPENYTSDDNPISTIGFSPIVGVGSAFGSLSGGGGVNAAFDANSNKGYSFCANRIAALLGFNNTIGKNWGTSTQPVPSAASTQTYNITQFTIIAPNNMPFLATGAVGYKFQGSLDGVTYTDLATGTTAGTIGESITGTPTGGSYQYHRIAFDGDGSSRIAIAQLLMSAPAPSSEV